MPPTPTPVQLSLVYSAFAPGPHCDPGGAQWSQASVSTAVNCSSQGTKLTELSTSAHYIAEIYFQGSASGYAFPRDYAISLDISNLTATTCAGVVTRGVGSEGYGLFVCRSGFWRINRYSSTGKVTTIGSGNAVSSTTYHLQVVANGYSQGIAIDGAGLNIVLDSSYLNTTYIGLAVDAFDAPGQTGSALLSNFTYSLIL